MTGKFYVFCFLFNFRSSLYIFCLAREAPCSVFCQVHMNHMICDWSLNKIINWLDAGVWHEMTPHSLPFMAISSHRIEQPASKLCNYFSQKYVFWATSEMGGNEVPKRRGGNYYSSFTLTIKFSHSLYLRTIERTFNWEKWLTTDTWIPH